MSYELKYILEFKNWANDTCALELYEEGGSVTLAEYLVGSERPVVMRGIDNSTKLETPIRGQELVAEIVTDTLSITDFISDSDQKWKCEFKVNDSLVFVGFLLQEDSQEDYVSYKKVLQLKFTDSLALLKGVELREANGSYWFGTPTFYQLISTCLAKTGLTLPINIFCNIFPTGMGTTESSFSINRVNTRSFMTNQRDFQDCYEVLESIMKAWGCTLYQYRGEWYVDRWSERIEQRTKLYNYTTTGVPTLVGTSYDIAPIGQTQVIKEVEDPLLFSVSRAAKEAKITYRYEQWPELIRNLDLDEGNQVVLLSDSTQRTYDLDYYNLVNGRVAFSRREIDTLGNETQRYMFINGDTNNLDLTRYVRTQSFPAQKGDKLRFSFSACSKNDLPGTAAIVYVKCGSRFLDDDGKWKTGAVFLRLDWASAEDSREWKTYEIESEEFLADGEVELRFLLMNGCSTGNETRYKDIRIEYIPIVNGSKSARGDFNRYDNPVTTKNPQGDVVKISDGPRKIVRGAILKNNEALEGSWFRDGETEERRFSQLNAFGYYQNYKRTKWKFQGNFRGLFFDTLSPVPLYPVGFYPIYTIDDAAGKLFTLVNLQEVDWKTGIWRGDFLEVNDEALDTGIKTMPSGYVFNYIFE